MTREEAIKDLEVIKDFFAENFDTIPVSIEYAIEALEQEPVIDKIRAEIKKSSHGKWYVGRLDGKTEEVLLLDEVLQIIDKYKGESEEA